MSRYYQSSYHASNDYKKYRQEKLKANDSKPQTTLKSSYQQTSIYKPSTTYNNKEHLQTFGKQDKSSFYDTRGQNGRNTDLSLKTRYQNYGTPQTNLDDNVLNKYSSRQRDYIPKSNNYLTERQNQITSSTQIIALKNSNPQQSSNFRSNSRFSKYDKIPQTFSSDNFQDSIISRRKDYGYQNIEIKNPGDRSYKNYNYSAKVNNLIQKNEDFIGGNEDKSYPMKRQFKQTKKLGQRNYLNSFQGQQRQKSPSYQSRNQMIKQRLNLNTNSESTNNFIARSNLKQQPQREYSSKVTGFSSRNISTHTTPQKSHLTTKDDKNLSQQRRKSLIEKSQMLKQKLNKLNTSSSKIISNQQNQQDPNHPQNNALKQNVTLQGYTPPKRFLSTSFNQNRQNSQITDRSISKKLDFDTNTRDLQTERNYDSTLKESNRNSSRNYMRGNHKQNSQDLTIKNNNLSATKKYSNEETGDGALKKIHELNERINSRLQSILKNYG